MSGGVGRSVLRFLLAELEQVFHRISELHGVRSIDHGLRPVIHAIRPQRR
jgi:hypothetical protein